MSSLQTVSEMFWQFFTITSCSLSNLSFLFNTLKLNTQDFTCRSVFYWKPCILSTYNYKFVLSYCFPLLTCLKFLSLSAIASFVYLTLLRLCPTIINFSVLSSSLRTVSLYKLNKSGEKLRHCPILLSSFVHPLNAFSICVQVVCHRRNYGLLE